MKNYDFHLTREDSGSHVYTGCIARRFTAAFIDVVFSLSVVFLIGVEGESNIAGLINLSLLIVVLFLPELLWRRTLGMLICGIVVLVPPNASPVKALAIRKLMNLLEFAMPSAVYYFIVALSDGNKSISDRCSACLLARKSYLEKGYSSQPRVNKVTRFLIPLGFTILPFLLGITLVAGLVLFMGTDLFWELVIKEIEAKPQN